MMKNFKMIYLATPYSRYRHGLERAFADAAALAARLIQDGLHVYSPIVHTHPIAHHGGMDPLDHAMWMKFDETMMRAANALLVAEMSGWQDSVGIAQEIKFFRHEGKPIFRVCPQTMSIVAHFDQV